MKGDSISYLSGQKGKAERLIYSNDNDIRFFQNKLGKTVLICRLLQLLVPLEVTDLLQGDNAIKEPRKQTAEKNSSTERRFNTIA